MDNLKLLAIVTGEGEFVNKNLRTGLWLSELTHIYHGAKKQGIEITVASPKGGDTPIDPESLNPLLMDEITKTCWEDSIFNIVLQAILKKQYENEKKVAAICHGVCGLLNVTLASGEYLVKDKKLTGFSRAEEILARKERVVPFDLETELKDRGARYEKALIPMTSKVVIDGNLFTGENPFSSKKMAEVILQCFSKK